jgi:glucosamine-6-phosphate deaminase
MLNELHTTPNHDAISRLNLAGLTLEVHPSRAEAGAAAARAAAAELIRLASLHASFAVIFATGASQLAMLDALTSLPGLPWDRVIGFHMDEYIGLDENHPASFRRYMREKLSGRVPMLRFHEIDGNAPDIEHVRRGYAQALEDAQPALCLLGIGENGHLAFNDPAEADFNDPLAMKVVTLDDACRDQQVAEGWFSSRDLVPRQALTLTIPALLRVPKLIASVPGARKAAIVRRTLEEPISTACPSTILRTHGDVTIYLDPDSAAELNLLSSTAK